MVSVIVGHGWLIVTIQDFGWPFVIRYYSGATLWMFSHRTPFILGNYWQKGFPSSYTLIFTGCTKWLLRQDFMNFWKNSSVMVAAFNLVCCVVTGFILGRYRGPLKAAWVTMESWFYDVVSRAYRQLCCSLRFTRHRLCLLDFQLECSFSGYV